MKAMFTVELQVCLLYQLNFNIKIWAALKMIIQSGFTFTFGNNYNSCTLSMVQNMKIALDIQSSAMGGHTRPKNILDLGFGVVGYVAD